MVLRLPTHLLLLDVLLCIVVYFVTINELAGLYHLVPLLLQLFDVICIFVICSDDQVLQTQVWRSRVEMFTAEGAGLFRLSI